MLSSVTLTSSRSLLVPRYVRPSLVTRAFSQSAACKHGILQASAERYTRLTRFWIPTGGLHAKDKQEDVVDKLIRAGYLRQSQPGIFHLLPLAQRVQTKLERLIDFYMSQLGASKVALSSLSSQALWQKTNRLDAYGPELFRLEDRKSSKLLLAPTHEEEITTLAAGSVQSYKDLPLRLYQIGRKYRDEMRPRQGLLRSREFMMKDLYTFDASVEAALTTYSEVREVYSQLFDTLKVPYLVAEASSGDIGGDLSHEYHLPTPDGEDHIISCNSCDYVANEELAIPAQPEDSTTEASAEMQMWRGITKDRKQIVHVWYPATVPNLATGKSRTITPADLNMHLIKSYVPLDSSISFHPGFFTKAADGAQSPLQLVHLVDHRVAGSFSEDHAKQLQHESGMTSSIEVQSSSVAAKGIDVLRIQAGDKCPKCSSHSLKVQKAIELGHTFHLGTKYSEALSAKVKAPDAVDRGATKQTFMQMGCHGIGVSRIIGAVAGHLADDKGLNWPRVIAPFEVAVVSLPEFAKDAVDVARGLADSRIETEADLDVLLDDRSASMGWKLKDADTAGYPVVVVLGRTWKDNRMCSVQCRRLGLTAEVALQDLAQHVRGILSQL